MGNLFTFHLAIPDGMEYRIVAGIADHCRRLTRLWGRDLY